MPPPPPFPPWRRRARLWTRPAGCASPPSCSSVSRTHHPAPPPPSHPCHTAPRAPLVVLLLPKRAPHPCFSQPPFPYRRPLPPPYSLPLARPPQRAPPPTDDHSLPVCGACEPAISSQVKTLPHKPLPAPQYTLARTVLPPSPAPPRPVPRALHNPTAPPPSSMRRAALRALPLQNYPRIPFAICLAPQVPCAAQPCVARALRRPAPALRGNDVGQAPRRLCNNAATPHASDAVASAGQLKGLAPLQLMCDWSAARKGGCTARRGGAAAAAATSTQAGVEAA